MENRRVVKTFPTSYKNYNHNRNPYSKKLNKWDKNIWKTLVKRFVRADEIQRSCLQREKHAHLGRFEGYYVRPYEIIDERSSVSRSFKKRRQLLNEPMRARLRKNLARGL